MINVIINSQFEDLSKGFIFLEEDKIGDIRIDGEKIDIILSRNLSLNNTIKLLARVNGLELDYYERKVEINYITK